MLFMQVHVVRFAPYLCVMCVGEQNKLYFGNDQSTSIMTISYIWFVLISANYAN